MRRTTIEMERRAISEKTTDGTDDADAAISIMVVGAVLHVHQMILCATRVRLVFAAATTGG